MSMFKRTLCAASAAIVLGLSATVAQAQPATYAYSAAITLGTPAGTSGAVNGTTNKKLPIGIKNLSCLPATKDQLSFTLKFDAGKPASGPSDDPVQSTLQNVYLIFSKDSGLFATVYRESTSGSPLTGLALNVKTATAIGASATTTTTDLNYYKTKPYYKSTNLLGGVQTEVFVGGPLPFEAFESGIWSATLIIAPETVVDFDDPSTWSAWDTGPFLLRKPWKGTDTNLDECL